MELALAIVLGTTFGLVLQRVGAADPNEIIKMLRLTDLRLMKAIALGIGLASGLLYIGMAAGVIDSGHLSVKSVYVGVIVGGLILGAGWALSGYCPGTSVAGAGSGRKDALVFLVGGLAGAGLFMLNYQCLQDTALFETLFGGKVTLADTGMYEALIGLDGTVVAILFAAAMIGIAFALPKALR